MEPLPPVSKEELKHMAEVANENAAENEYRSIYNAVINAAKSGIHIYEYRPMNSDRNNIMDIIANKLRASFPGVYIATIPIPNRDYTMGIRIMWR